MKYNERYEERASEMISLRNKGVKNGLDPDGKNINYLEERASRYLSRAKGKVR